MKRSPLQPLFDIPFCCVLAASPPHYLNQVINTSVSEGMSGALLEAMACGCPVLARDIPGNRALLTSPSSSDSSKGNESTGKEFTNTGSVGSVAADNLASKTAAGSVVYREGKGWEEVESGYLFTTPASFVEAAEVVLRGEAVDVAARAQVTLCIHAHDAEIAFQIVCVGLNEKSRRKRRPYRRIKRRKKVTETSSARLGIFISLLSRVALLLHAV